VLAALGVPTLECVSYEADDILATVARLAEERGAACFLVSNDKDCRQLISDRVAVYNIRKDEVFDALRLEQEWGISPSQMVDYQALVGDSVDNVPGVPLIGPKFAKQLLLQYGTLDAILAHAGEAGGGKRGENLVKYRDQALLSRELVRLHCSVPLEINWNACRAGQIDRQAAHQLFAEFGFRSMGEKLDAMLKASG
jgi:DNA polymerase-1